MVISTIFHSRGDIHKRDLLPHYIFVISPISGHQRLISAALLPIQEVSELQPGICHVLSFFFKWIAQATGCAFVQTGSGATRTCYEAAHSGEGA